MNETQDGGFQIHQKQSEHIGEPGSFLGRRLVGIESVTKLDAEKLRGKTRWCVALRDESGNRIVFFTNDKPSLREHMVTFVDGVVKRHGEHDGVKQTEISDMQFFRTRESVTDYNVAERFRVLCRRIGIAGEIVAPRIVRLKCELPEDVTVARRYATNAAEILKLPCQVILLEDGQTLECRLGNGL